MGNFCSSSKDAAGDNGRKSRYAAAEPHADAKAAGASGNVRMNSDGSAPRVDVGYRQEPALFADDCGATALCAADDGSIVVGSEEGMLVRVDGSTGEILQQWQGLHTRDINKVMFNAATGMAFTCSRDKLVRAVAIGREADRPLTFAGHDLVVTCVAPRHDGRHVVSGSRDNTFRLWDVEQETLIASQDRKLNVIHSCAWVEELGIVAQGGEDLAIRLWDFRASGKDCGGLSLSNSIENFDYHPVCMALLDDGVGTTLVTGHNGFNGTGAMVSTWDLRMRKPLDSMHGHENTVRWVAPVKNSTRASGPPSSQLFSASDDGTIREWDLSSHSLKSTYRVPEGRLTTVVELPGSHVGKTGRRRFAAATRAGTVFVAEHEPSHDALLRSLHLGSAIAC
jgi:WD40 repeat protein